MNFKKFTAMNTYYRVEQSMFVFKLFQTDPKHDKFRYNLMLCNPKRCSSPFYYYNENVELKGAILASRINSKMRGAGKAYDKNRFPTEIAGLLRKASRENPGSDRLSNATIIKCRDHRWSFGSGNHYVLYLIEEKNGKYTGIFRFENLQRECKVIASTLPEMISGAEEAAKEIERLLKTKSTSFVRYNLDMISAPFFNERAIFLSHFSKSELTA